MNKLATAAIITIATLFAGVAQAELSIRYNLATGSVSSSVKSYTQARLNKANSYRLAQTKVHSVKTKAASDSQYALTSLENSRHLMSVNAAK